jgi:hypothetical protein
VTPAGGICDKKANAAEKKPAHARFSAGLVPPEISIQAHMRNDHFANQLDPPTMILAADPPASFSR